MSTGRSWRSLCHCCVVWPNCFAPLWVGCTVNLWIYSYLEGWHIWLYLVKSNLCCHMLLCLLLTRFSEKIWLDIEWDLELYEAANPDCREMYTTWASCKLWRQAEEINSYGLHANIPKIHQYLLFLWTCTLFIRKWDSGYIAFALPTHGHITVVLHQDQGHWDPPIIRP